MKTKLVILGSVAIVGAVVLVVYARGTDKTPQHKKSQAVADNHGIDSSDTGASLNAMSSAPDGATPCESAYNSFAAEQASAQMRKSKSLFRFVAPKDEFIATCQTLPAETQKCMLPRYQRAHPDCMKLKPPQAVLDKMYQPAFESK